MKRSDRWLCMLGCVAVLLTLGGIAAGFMGVETVGLMQVGAMQVSTVGGLYCLWPQRVGLRRGVAGAELVIYTVLMALRVSGVWPVGAEAPDGGAVTMGVLVWLALAGNLLYKGKPEEKEKTGSISAQMLQ